MMDEPVFFRVWEFAVRGYPVISMPAAARAGSAGDVLSVDVPCGRCALSLRGRHRHGQCPECGMDVSKSLAVAAVRSEDPAHLEQIAVGLRSQAWGTVISLLACVAGPLVFHRIATLESLAFASAVAFSSVAAMQLAPFDAAGQLDEDIPHSSTRRRVCGLVMALGGAVMILPALLLGTSPVHPAGRSTLVLFLAGAVVWFIGECLKLRILESCAAGIPGRELVRHARTLRIGAYAATAFLALGAMPAAAERPVSGAYVVTGSVTVLLLSALSALVYGRVSQSLQQQATFARAVRNYLPINSDPRPLPDEPDWQVGPT